MECRVDRVYETVMGLRTSEAAEPDVNNLFAEGGRCDKLYEEVYAAKNNLNRRLTQEEDRDVEQIIRNLLNITKIVSYEMYSYGITDSKNTSR